MATSNPSKKVVQSTQAAAEPPADGPAWQPRPEDRAKANRQRLIAIVLWVVAIAIECFVIFGLLLKQPVQENYGDGFVTRYPFLWMNLTQNAYFVWLIVLIVICGVLAIAGSQFWKKANKADPASEKNKVRFFIQNQLGMILSLIAFIPLLVLVLMNKNLKGAQKGTVIAVAAVVLAATAFFGTELNPASSEQYATDQAFVIAQNGSDVVYWVKGGYTWHLCQQSTDLQHPSKDDQIYSGTVGQAHAAGKTDLAKRNECGVDNTSGTAIADWAAHPSTTSSSPAPTETPR